MGINIKSKKSVLGNKVTLEESHLAEIEDYIKSLEVKNAQLIKENKGLESKLEKKEIELEKYSEVFNDLAQDKDLAQENIEYLNEKIEHMSSVIPEADKFSRSYDLLLNYQQNLHSSNSLSDTYDMDEYDVVQISKFGPEVANEFVSNGNAIIPMQRQDIKANLYFSGDSYERNDGGTINQYTDYKVAVDVTDKESREVTEYDLYTFVNKYKDDIRHLDNEKLSEKDHENKGHEIDQRRNHEAKKMAMKMSMER